MKNIGICLLSTNIYFLLGLRFIHKWNKHYKGNSNITFYLFADRDPCLYLEKQNVVYIYSKNDSWVDGTNSKFTNIIKLKDTKEDNLYYFDADTNISKDFTDEWYLGDLVGGQHYADQDRMKNIKCFDRNPNSEAYVPLDTDLPETYYYGAFFGGTKDRVVDLCKTLYGYQQADKKINYEPSVNDESYINKEFHYNPPTKVVKSSDFEFDISDKGGLDNTRNTEICFNKELSIIEENKNKPFDIKKGEIFFI